MGSDEAGCGGNAQAGAYAGHSCADAELDAWIEGKEKPTSVKFENAQVTMQQPTINGPINDIHDNDKVNMGGE